MGGGLSRPGLSEFWGGAGGMFACVRVYLFSVGFPFFFRCYTNRHRVALWFGGGLFYIGER